LGTQKLRKDDLECRNIFKSTAFTLIDPFENVYFKRDIKNVLAFLNEEKDF
jgi:arginine deiminase